MKTVIDRTGEIVLNECPEFVRAGFAVHKRADSRYCLFDLWSLIFFDYEARVELDDITVRVKPGYVALLPPGVTKIFHFRTDSLHYTVHFKAALPEKGGSPVRIPWLIDAADQRNLILGLFREIMTCWTVNPPRATMRLWDILFRLSDVPPPGDDSQVLHPAVRTAMQLIDSRLEDFFTVQTLAVELEISPNHLTLLFKKHLGQSVAGYIRERRMNLVRHYLTHTNKPIKEIAIEAGMPDLQFFNKSIRRFYGMSPRKLQAECRKKAFSS